jgi:hypothetical protein
MFQLQTALPGARQNIRRRADYELYQRMPEQKMPLMH